MTTAMHEELYRALQVGYLNLVRRLRRDNALETDESDQTLLGCGTCKVPLPIPYYDTRGNVLARLPVCKASWVYSVHGGEASDTIIIVSCSMRLQFSLFSLIGSSLLSTFLFNNGVH